MFFLKNVLYILSTSKNFQLESVIKKRIGHIRWITLFPKRRELDLKLFEGQPFKANKNYIHSEDLKDLKIIALPNFNTNPYYHNETDLHKKNGQIFS